MSRTVARVLAVLVAVAAVAMVGVIAYGFGLGSGQDGHAYFGPHGFRMGTMMGWGSQGWFGFGWFPFLLVVSGAVVVIVLLMSVGRAPSPMPPSSPIGQPQAGSDIDRLSQLTEMHNKGALTDDEFTAAKRKLLGL